MTGSISEWCTDFYDKDYYMISEQINPQGPEKGEDKALCDGAWEMNLKV